MQIQRYWWNENDTTTDTETTGEQPQPTIQPTQPPQTTENKEAPSRADTLSFIQQLKQDISHT